jgi:hypothetical protein
MLDVGPDHYPLGPGGWRREADRGWCRGDLRGDRGQLGWSSGVGTPAAVTPGGTPIFIPRQHGGPVSPSRPYIVGEAGPEIFRPKTSGDVIPLGAHVTPMQFGGRVMAGQALLAGEVGPEAFVPRGAAPKAARGEGAVVNIDSRVINNAPVQATQTVRQGAGGHLMIETLIENGLTASARTGRLDQVMGAFGGRRQGIRRS